jgi:hypothetical protein
MSTRATAVVAMIGALAIGCERSAKDQIADGAAGPERTVTGCLQSGDEGKSFVLRASSGARQPEQTNKQQEGIFRVVAPRDVDLSAHLGDRISVTGHVVEVPVNVTDRKGPGEPVGTSGRTRQNAPNAGAPKNGANVAPQQNRPDLVDVPVLRVARINHVEGRCDARP